MKQISVILPVYNGENFLDKCIQSLLAQRDIDMSKVEILAINDGSLDNSVTLLKSYCDSHPHLLRLIDRANKGTAATRNEGIQQAQGKYVTFVDQDDYLDPDFLAVYYDEVVKGGYDVVQGGFNLVNRDYEIVRKVMPIDSQVGRLRSIPGWAKLYKRSFLKENNIEFFANNIGEDNVFMANIIASTNNYRVISYAGYNNFFDNESNVTNTFHKGLSPDVKIVRLLNVLSKMKASDPQIQQLLNYNVIRTAVYYLLAYGRQASASRFKEVFYELTMWIDNYVIKLDRRSEYIPFGMRGDAYAARLGILIFFILRKLHLVNLFSHLYCRGKSTEVSS